MGKETDAKRREGNEIEFARIVAFSDGVFAIAITLLVLALQVPDKLDQESLSSVLWAQREDMLAYALSFAVIGRFWLLHHRFFGEVVGFDGRLLALNILYLAWIALIPFSSEVLGDHGGEGAAIVLYAINLTGVVLTATWMLPAPAVRASRRWIRRRIENSATGRSTSPPSFSPPFRWRYSPRNWRRSCGWRCSSTRPRASPASPQAAGVHRPGSRALG